MDPNNLHIANTEEENTIRVRILDPIACTDSYPLIMNSEIAFSQYGLNIHVLFETDSSGKLTVEKEDSTISFSIYKTTDRTYWGPCD